MTGTHWLRRIVDLILGIHHDDPLGMPTFEINSDGVLGPDAPPCIGYQQYAAQPLDRARVISSHLPAELLPKSVQQTNGIKVLSIPFFAMPRPLHGTFSDYVDSLLDNSLLLLSLEFR